MFTGLIEEVGVVCNVQKSGQAMVLEVGAHIITKGLQLGDSIAVNGACLTATKIGTDFFTADAVPETLKMTNLGDLKVGDPVNLERAMPADGRFGGHIVSGHVDGKGKIMKRWQHGNAVNYKIEVEKQHLLRYMIPKGSITVDGISLTIVSVEDNAFTVSIIPHTLTHTVLSKRHVGDMVNLECDMIPKYVERLMTFLGKDDDGGKQEEGLTKDFLIKSGFLDKE
jgi:riboflavin synthase